MHITSPSLRTLLLGIGLVFAAASAHAELAGLTSKDTSAGLKEALTRGAEFAVAELGKENGFLGNDKVRIGLPGSLQKIEGMARKLGLAKQTDELINTMNHAAESAVVEARPLLMDAVKKMSVKDATSILTGPPDAATQYFRNATGEQLATKFAPIVKKATAKVQLADKFNAYASKAAKFNLIDEKDANLDGYVTGKAIDGLFIMIAEQEKQIRQDPIGTGSKLLSKVFGALGK
jgi:hypothetical protein